MASQAPQVAAYAPVVHAKKSGKGTPRWAKILIGCLIAVACVGGAIGFVNVFGRVYGTELCAETLERRSFSFLEIPFIGWQIQATRHLDVSGSLEKYLATEKLVPAPPAAKKTWHVVNMARGLTGARRGDPAILCLYLDAHNNKHELAWLKWSEDNPKLAPHVWRGVCELSLAGEYTAVPDLFELTQGATDAIALQAEINRLVMETVVPAPSEAMK